MDLIAFIMGMVSCAALFAALFLMSRSRSRSRRDRDNVRPTIAELEAILKEGDVEIEILPNGEIRSKSKASRGQ
jgi:hypothetical protein